MSLHTQPSLELHYLLDQFGYSEEDIKQRIHYYNRCSYARNISNKLLTNKYHVDKIFVGSRREGTSMKFVSDHDIMLINNGVNCTESPYVSDPGPENIFQMVFKNIPPGYCKLKLLHVGNQVRIGDTL